jgi:hypothetical protein
MKWLGKWLLKLATNAVDQEREAKIYGGNYAVTKSSGISIRGSDVDGDDGLNITVRKAIGGKIVTFRTYDHKTDRHQHKLYIIPDDLDFERELGKMITLESMRG